MFRPPRRSTRTDPLLPDRTRFRPAVLGAGSVGIGNSAVVTGSRSGAIGDYSAASGFRSTSLGDHSFAQGDQSIAIGSDSGDGGVVGADRKSTRLNSSH